jgi:hypothetical protein
MAMARPRGSTTVVCRDSLARLLRMIGAREFLTLRRADDV